ncbi:MAG: hypothetical protein ACRDRI_23680 [Pseudonocardiaceae bacterium]
MTTVEPMSAATIAVAHHATTGGAWLAAVRMAAANDHKLLHLRVTITDPHRRTVKLGSWRTRCFSANVIHPYKPWSTRCFLPSWLDPAKTPLSSSPATDVCTGGSGTSLGRTSEVPILVA